MACLVRLGHANAWDYPWGVFTSALDEAREAAEAAEAATRRR